MMKMLPYTFTAEWIKGKDHLAADALSRFPVDEPCLEDELCESHAEAAVNVHFVDKSTTSSQLQTTNKPMVHSWKSSITYKLGGLKCEMKSKKKHAPFGPFVITSTWRLLERTLSYL
jgi:hypothetical protein